MNTDTYFGYIGIDLLNYIIIIGSRLTYKKFMIKHVADFYLFESLIASTRRSLDNVWNVFLSVVITNIFTEVASSFMCDYNIVQQPFFFFPF